MLSLPWIWELKIREIAFNNQVQPKRGYGIINQVKKNWYKGVQIETNCAARGLSWQECSLTVKKHMAQGPWTSASIQGLKAVGSIFTKKNQTQSSKPPASPIHYLEIPSSSGPFYLTSTKEKESVNQ